MAGRKILSQRSAVSGQKAEDSNQEPEDRRRKTLRSIRMARSETVAKPRAGVVRGFGAHDSAVSQTRFPTPHSHGTVGLPNDRNPQVNAGNGSRVG